MSHPRRRALLLTLLAAGCTDTRPARTSFPPLRYDYLLKLQLDVGSVEIGQPPPPSALEAQDPAPPGQALVQMAQDRLLAGGTSGRAVFVIDDARIVRDGRALRGALAVHLDVVGPDGARRGYAEARVERQLVGLNDDLPGALYDITAQMMQDMNVEFEYQVRRSLGGFLQAAGAAPAPAAVEQQPLGPSGQPASGPPAALSPPASDGGEGPPPS